MYVIVVNTISFLCSCLKSISRGIICHHYFRVIMNSKTAAFHISMIPPRWYKDIHQDVLNLQESIVYSCEKNNEPMDKGILPIRKPATIPATVPTIKKAVYKRNLYGRVWGLVRTATLLAVEQDDDEITTFLQDYIRRKSNEYMQERPAIDKSPAIDERPVIRKRPLAAVNDEIPDNAHEINECNINADSESNEIEEEIEEEIEQENEITNLNNVKNLNKVTGRGRPCKRRYLSSVEKEQGLHGKPKTRGSYKCRVCQQVGHNTAFHKSTGNN
ncbi:hypothetical protein C2G38_2304707 [Gigaspora rosea]|uniref:SWIM-type domain-containing protein n=1 Tax=Gigaspora rosea TaxID=44941 RepID=A0A397VCQ2_9GLOM|nr:hypothetical protein C2G38_2304707 [Gigaspora rosea]